MAVEGVGHVQTLVQQKPMPQFYRRPLPDTCVDFSSQEGRSLFIGALNEGNMNIYFKLAAQFLTQEEPSFCGLSTLVMVLNALEVDPARVWKGAWRWYHERMLDCCVPLENVIKTGITVDHFECLARCNRLNVVRFNPPPSTKEISEEERHEGIEDFRSAIRQTVRSEYKVLVTSYCRKTFGQTGLGHFSPLAAYNEDSDKVLLMDVARFKYPPHWVDVSLLWESMRELDPDTSKPRGYFILSMNEDLKPMLLLRLIEPPTLQYLVGEMKHWFTDCETRYAGKEMDIKGVALTFVEAMAATLKNVRVLDLRDDYITVEQNGGTSCGVDNCKEMSDKLIQSLVQEVVNSLEGTAEYKHLMKASSVGDSNEALDQVFQRRALLTVGLFFSWPFEIKKACTICQLLADYCRSIIKTLPGTAQNEIESLKTQISVLLEEQLII